MYQSSVHTECREIQWMHLSSEWWVGLCCHVLGYGLLQGDHYVAPQCAHVLYDILYYQTISKVCMVVGGYGNVEMEVWSEE